MTYRFRVARGAAPEHRAFEELLSANLDSLYRTSLRLCRGRSADAEDLLQDAVLRAFAGRAALRDTQAGRGWLFTTLVRTHLNRTRAERRRHEQLASDLTEHEFEHALAGWPASSPAEYADREATRIAVRDAVDALNIDLRAVLMLVDVEGFSHREAAAMLELPQGTVASRLFRARRTVKDALAADNVARIRRTV